MAVTCPACQAQLPDGSRFCNLCGTALGAAVPAQRSGYTPQHLIDRVLKHRSALEGERKQVTVLFADMAGSTRLAETVDPEDWHSILDEFFGLLGEEIHRYEGTINQYTGDGIMALFGAPVAHEDHAQRACHAALALQRRLREFADGLRLSQGINLSVRMGLNSGEVVVGRIGDDLRMDYTAQGLTVNLAARMEQIAEPGRIYLTRATADLIEGYFELRDLGAMRVKGNSEAVAVFELIAPTQASLRLEVSRSRGLSAFTGRRAELEQLESLMGEVRAGRGRIAVVVGDGGIGKSRLCFEALERWRGSGTKILHVSAVPYSKSVPLLPIRDLLLQRFGVVAGDSPASARDKIAGVVLMLDPALRDQLPLVFSFLDLADGRSPAPDLPPDAQARRVLDLFARVCPTDVDDPVVIVVEDLHWIDAPSEEFLKLIVCAVAEAPLLLLFNTRPGLLPDWLEAASPLRLNLRPLGADAMAELTEELLGPDPALASLARRIAEMAAGNPFFVEETVRALAARGVLVGSPGAYGLGDEGGGGIDIPASVHALVAGRIDFLGEDAKHLLQCAAVLGKAFRLDVLRAVCGMSPESVESSLEELKAGRYLQLERPQEPVEYGFCHPLFQEVAYASLLGERRRQIHAAVAGQYEQQLEADADSADLVMHLAHHWYESGEVLPAARWSLAASVSAAAQDLQLQMRMIRRTLDLLGPDPAPGEATRLAIGGRSALIRVSTFYPVPTDEVDTAYSQARGLAERSGDQLALAELLISNGSRMLRFARADLAADNTREAMALAQEIGDPSLESRFRIPILFSHFACGRLEEVLTLLDRRDGGDWHRGPIRQDNHLSRGFRALMVACLGRIEEGLAESEAVIAFAESLDRSVSWMYANLVDLELLAGRSDRVLGHARRAVEQAQEYGSPLFDEVAYRALAQAHLARGDAAESARILGDYAGLVDADAVAFQFRSAHYLLWGLAELGQGDLSAARGRLDDAVDSAIAARMDLWELRARLGRARLFALSGDDDGEDLETCRSLLERTACRAFEPEYLDLAAHRAVRLGDEPAAATLREQAADLRRTLGIALAPGAAESMAG